MQSTASTAVRRRSVGGRRRADATGATSIIDVVGAEQPLGIDRAEREGHPARDRQDHPGRERAPGRGARSARRRRRAGPARQPPSAAAPAQPATTLPGSRLGHRQPRERHPLRARDLASSTRRCRSSSTRCMAGAKRQVLIEATVAEVQLRNEYQRGIEWQRLQSSGISIGQPGSTPTTSATPGFTPARASVRGFVSSGGSFTADAASCWSSSATCKRALQPEAVGAQQPDGDPARHARHHLLHDHALDAADHLRRRRRRHDVRPGFVHHHAERRRRGIHDGGAAADQRDRLRWCSTCGRPSGGGSTRDAIRTRRCRRADRRRSQRHPGFRDARVRLDPAPAERPDRRARRA